MFLVLCLLLILPTACRSSDPPPLDPSEEEPNDEGNNLDIPEVIDEAYLIQVGSGYLESLFSGAYSEAYTTYPHDENMIAAIDPEAYEAFFVDMYANYGPFIEFVGSETRFQGDFGFYTTGVVLEQNKLNANVVIDKEGRIAGFNFGAFSFEDEIAQDPPEGFKEISIVFGDNDWPLDGKITTPDTSGTHPMVILVHGSGPNDMNETIGANAPFRDMAYYLAERGVSVLRYDKRTYTYGAVMGGMKDLTVYGEVIDDVVEAVAFASSLEYVDPDQIYVLGHSLGAYLMPRIAEVTPDAAGYMMAAGIFSSLGEIVPYQIEYLSALDGEITDEELAYIEAMTEEAHKSLNPELIGDDEVILGAYRPYWEDLAAYDPVEMAREIEKPVFVFQGDRDYQVPISEFSIIYEALKDQDNYSFKVYEGINHLLIYGESAPTPEEYYVKGHVHEPLLEDIILFVQNQL
jgi:hypothetical protein